MRRSVRFLLVLVTALGLLAFVASTAPSNTVRAWFEHDVASRSRLVVVSAQESPNRCEIVLGRLRQTGVAAFGARGMGVELPSEPVHFSATALEGDLVRPFTKRPTLAAFGWCTLQAAFITPSIEGGSPA